MVKRTSRVILKSKHNKRLVFAPDGRSDRRRDAAPAAQAWRYEKDKYERSK